MKRRGIRGDLDGLLVKHPDAVERGASDKAFEIYCASMLLPI
jgi:hypothetical protein